MIEPVISLKNIVKSYSIEGVSTVILKQLSLSIHRGDFLAIVGASGSGKSTLMNIMGLLDKADAGEYHLLSQDVAHLSSDELARLRNQQIGFVFQQFNLLSRLNVLQNVALPLSYRLMEKSEVEARVETVLKRVGMLPFIKHRPQQLSGGQQQRVAIARALIGGPEVILADEPTGSLDSATGNEILHFFLELHAEGKTIVLITHDEKIAQRAERRITMVDGNILCAKPAEMEISCM